MATNPYFAGNAALGLRMQEFNKTLEAKTESELFELFRYITGASKTAPTGNAEGQSEDILLKSLAVEALIFQRSNGAGLTKYNAWLANENDKPK